MVKMNHQVVQDILQKRRIPPIVTSILGAAIGTLVDLGMKPEEIRATCDLLIAITSKAVQNPDTIAAVKNFRDVLKEA
jgi:hypothetical protein